ncbi:MAG: PilN domain-containing protein [Caulobacteraceae bacterium]
MTLQELLNADVRSLGGLLARGFAWWIDELASMAPHAWRESLSSRPKVLAERIGPGTWRYWKPGRPHAAEPPPAKPSRVGLVLPAGAALVRELEFPTLPLRDVKRMVALDIDRLSPLKPELVHFDVEREAGRQHGAKQKVRLGILPRAVASDILAAAAQEGLSPIALGIASVEQPGGHRFDFLPAAIAAAGGSQGEGAARWWWVAVAALLALNLALLVGRDAASVSRLRQIVQSQRAGVDAATGLRARVEREDERRRSLMDRKTRDEPLRMLNTLTLAIPEGAWVQHLEWNGDILRIVGFAAPDLNIPAAVRGTPAFTNPRSLTTEAAPKLANGTPFDITAVAKKRPAR